MAISFDDLKQKLEQEHERLRAELAEINGQAVEGGFGYSTHQADDATMAFDQAAGEAVRRNAERMLYDIERALARMREGTYGTCRDCGKKIDHARLRVIPYARYCLDCAHRHEEQ
jgi:RNA polymerase-binding transcription factor DksA